MNNPIEDLKRCEDFEVYNFDLELSDIKKGVTLTQIEEAIENISIDADVDVVFDNKGINTRLLIEVQATFTTEYLTYKSLAEEFLQEQKENYETKLNDIIDEFQE